MRIELSILLCTCSALCLIAQPVLAQDCGGEPPPPDDQDCDGILDAEDNCLLASNPVQCDLDLDGYGNLCDADFDNDWLAGLSDTVYLQAGLAPGAFVPDFEEADMNCDLSIDDIDFTRFQELLGLPPGPSGLDCAGTAPCPGAGNVDGDGVIDPDDNCSELANSLQCDTDVDGYGNHCDGDFTNETNTVGLVHFGMFRASFSGAFNPDTDMNCNGTVGLEDFGLLRRAFQLVDVGPSSWPCAGLPGCTN